MYSKTVIFPTLLFIVFFLSFTTGNSDGNKTQSIPDVALPDWIQPHLIKFGQKKYGGKRKIDTFILHSMYNPSSQDSFEVSNCLDLLKQYGVSAHFMVDRGGNIYQLVPLNDISYHAGISQVPDGRKNANTFSLGVEIINSKYTEPTKAQYQSVIKLTQWVDSTYQLKYILRHSDIAPDRKTDPWNFKWEPFLKYLKKAQGK